MAEIFDKKLKIDGKAICLSPLDESCATKEYCSWLNDPDVNKYLETKQATIAGIKKYIEEKNKNPNCLFLGIFSKKNQKHIGNVKLEPIDFKERKAIFGILIGDKSYWGKGIGTEATVLLVNYAFNNLKLKEIGLGVLLQNKFAIRVYEKVGFKLKKMNKKGGVTMSIKNKILKI